MPSPLLNVLLPGNTLCCSRGVSSRDCGTTTAKASGESTIFKFLDMQLHASSHNRHKSHLTLKSISPFVRSLLEKFEQFPPLRSRPAPSTGHHSPQHSCAPTPQKYDYLAPSLPTPQKYALPPNLPTPQKYALPPNLPTPQKYDYLAPSLPTPQKYALPPNLPTPQKYALPPNLPTPQKYALPPNPPLLQDLPKMTVQEMEFKEATLDIQKAANQNYELLAPASRHNETDVVSDEDESQNTLERVWAKLFQAAQNAQEEHFDFKN
jgi:hypothetical protein